MENYGKKDQFINDLKSGVFANMVSEAMRGEAFNNSKEIYNTLKPLVATHDDVEKMYCIFMDAKNRIIEIDPMFSGTISQAPVYARELVKAAIRLKATAMILAHNHPSGQTDPSPEDMSITKQTQFALSVISVTLHDHVVLGANGKFFSFADQGLIAGFKHDIDVFFSN